MRWIDITFLYFIIGLYSVTVKQADRGARTGDGTTFLLKFYRQTYIELVRNTA